MDDAFAAAEPADLQRATSAAPPDPGDGGGGGGGDAADHDAAARKSAAPRDPIGSVMDVRLDVQVRLGEIRMPVSRILELGRGSLLDLARRPGDPIDILVGGRLVARGDLVRTAEDGVGITLTEVLDAPAGSGA